MLDKIKGSLIGGAVGDALGYAVEFLQDSTIFAKYGERGITEYELTDGKALISDDTQMTMFTAEGLLRAKAKHKTPTVENYVEEIHRAYLDWYTTQLGGFDPSLQRADSPLLSIPELYACRAPGVTCCSALRQGVCGTIENRVNNSKGCGGVMRIAPVPLMLTADASVSTETSDMISLRAAAITHGHDLGFVPAAFVSHVISEILLGKDILTAVTLARECLEKYPCDYDELAYFDGKIAMAIELAQDADIDELDAIRYIGQGWVAEETAAIAVYCALKHSQDFEAAMIAAVNHSGDSDSTGAVTGNILGAYLGYSAIPCKFIDNLELKDELIELAEILAK